jgi:hypothetical protein
LTDISGAGPGVPRTVPPAPTFGTPPDPEPNPVDDVDYPQTTKVIGGVLTIFFPFVTLVAALILRSSERGATRRATLRTWAIASGAWLGVGILIGIIVAVSAASSVAHHTPSTSGPCDGGPDMGSTGVSIGHGNYRFPCSFGGSTVVHLGN